MTTSPTDSHVCIAVLAGGQSRRMGRDKALLPLDGTTLLARTVALAASAVGATCVVVVGRERPSDWPATDLTPFLLDDLPGDGPLGAIAVALRWAASIGGDRVAVLSCDLPLLSRDAVSWLIAAADSIIGDGVAVLSAEGRIEPLFSVYATRCQSAIAAQQAIGRRSPTALIERGDFRRLDAPDFVRRALVDVDTPEAWQAVLDSSASIPST